MEVTYLARLIIYKYSYERKRLCDVSLEIQLAEEKKDEDTDDRGRQNDDRSNSSYS
jgi:hypothetical protein